MFEADPYTQRMIDWATAADLPPLYTLEAPAARLQSAAGTAKTAIEPEPMAKVESIAIDGPGGELMIRLYTPTGVEPGALPIHVYLHGGGFVIGTLDTHDSIARRMANRAGCLVASVDYRLAPEHRYPAAVEDTMAALAWATANGDAFGGDPSRIAVGGDSAGGNLAAVAAQKLRDAGGPALACQVLIYPLTDHAMGDFASRRDHSDTFPIREPVMTWFHEHYFGHTDPVSEQDASPLHCEDFAGLPPAYVLTAGLDPLLDEGKAYADKLTAAGVDVVYKCYETTIHGFLQMGKVIPAAEGAIDEIGDYLKARFDD